MRSLTLPLLAAGACAVERGVVAASRLDELELERWSGTLAVALAEGLPLDASQLSIIAHLRGSAIFGALAAPLVALLGPELVALKVLAVAWSALGAFLLVWLAQRHAGSKAAWTALALFVLAPPAFQKIDVLALGSHADTVPFLIAPLLLLLGRGERAPLGRAAACGLGALVGAGLLFSMQALVALPALVLVAVALARGRGTPPQPIAATASRAGWALVGAAPFLMLVPLLTRSATVVNRSIESRFLGDIGAAPGKLLTTLAVDLRRACGFAEEGLAWAGWALCATAAVAAAAALAAVPWRLVLRRERVERLPRRLLGLFALAHVGALVVAYAASDFRLDLGENLDGMGARYMAPAWPGVVLLIALLVQRAWERRGSAIAALVASPAVAAGVAGTASLLAVGIALQQPPVLATDFAAFRDHLPRACPTLDERLEWLDRLEPDWGTDRALAHVETFVEREDWRAAWRDANVHAADTRAALASPEALRPYRFAALGACTGRVVQDELRKIDCARSERLRLFVEASSRACANVPPRDAAWWMRGFGREVLLVTTEAHLHVEHYGGHVDPLAHVFALVSARPEPARTWLLEGMGFEAGRRASPWNRNTRLHLEVATTLAPGPSGTWHRAFGRGYRMRFRESTYSEPGRLRVEDWMDPAATPHFRAGLATVAGASWGQSSADGEGSPSARASTPANSAMR